MTWAKYDLGVHAGSEPRLARFIESAPIGTLIEDCIRGTRCMVADDDFVPLTIEQKEELGRGAPLGYVASLTPMGREEDAPC